MSNSIFITDAKNKSKAAWSVVKEELGVKKVNNNFSDIKVHNNLTSKGDEIVEFFNNKFIGTSKELGILSNIDMAIELTKNGNQLQYPKFSFRNVTPTGIVKAIKSIKNKPTSGYDEIPVEILKQVANYISHPLSVIITQSFHKCVFPNKLKYMELKPLLKKGERQDPDSYRPVSVLTSFSKIFEKLAFEQLSHFLEDNDISAIIITIPA